ncbi:MAG: S8 family serine peptidase [Pseudonocardiales bacterium]|nr:S8 family serine peptidase [Pseudonocardiales bacterium]
MDTTPGGTASSRPRQRGGPPRSVVSPALQAGVPEEVRRRVVPVGKDQRSPVLVELDLTVDVRTEDTRQRFLALYDHSMRGAGAPNPRPVADCYVSCVLNPQEIQDLVAADRATGAARTVFRVWPDYTLHPHLDRSVSTIKSDAAVRSYAATGDGVIWAVLDSGIDQHHPHFASGTLTGAVATLHHDFTYLLSPDAEPAKDPDTALLDPEGHGTHVAGIIAGAVPDKVAPVIASQQPSQDGLPGGWVSRQLDPGRTLAGTAPQAKLVSLKVLAPDGRDGLVTSSSAVIAALYHIRETVNSGGRALITHGANLSLGCRWDPSDYAAGQSPLCREIDLLVGTGVVVVVSAGNNGYSGAASQSSDSRGELASITDPGNAQEAITVGSTHRDSPHRYGVTYTSSKGPTLDGRLKPDLLAPGERITSCATGHLRKKIAGLVTDTDAIAATYIEDSGTSMAAAHVSGAIAAFLSVRREFVGRPREVKELFTTNATSLGRDRFMEGHGLIDLMRVLSNV